MPKRDRAAYEYRRRLWEDSLRTPDPDRVRIAELEAEVARLKRELASRPEQRAIQRGSG